jgi:hypothetical protein
MLPESRLNPKVIWDECTIAGCSRQTYRTRKIFHQDELAAAATKLMA